MTPQQLREVKKERRREMNKIAAQNSRERKKVFSTILEQRLSILIGVNKKMEQRIKQLEAERVELGLAPLPPLDLQIDLEDEADDDTCQDHSEEAVQGPKKRAKKLSTKSASSSSSSSSHRPRVLHVSSSEVKNTSANNSASASASSCSESASASTSASSALSFSPQSMPLAQPITAHQTSSTTIPARPCGIMNTSLPAQVDMEDEKEITLPISGPVRNITSDSSAEDVTDTDDFSRLPLLPRQHSGCYSLHGGDHVIGLMRQLSGNSLGDQQFYCSTDDLGADCPSDLGLGFGPLSPGLPSGTFPDLDCQGEKDQWRGRGRTGRADGSSSIHAFLPPPLSLDGNISISLAW